MKRISVAKVAFNTLLIATVIGGCNLLIPRGEDVTAGASVETTYVEEQVKQTVEYAIPYGDTGFKTYMDFRKITNTGSDQYKLQQECWTDSRGLRRYEDDYVVALGSYYSKHIGDRFEVTLDSGKTFTVIVGDFKADCDTDETNRYSPMSNGGKNVLEFIVSVRDLDDTTRKMGDISYAGFKGNIQSIERL